MRAYTGFLIAICALLWAAPAALSQSAPVLDGRYASIAVDSDSREILHARKIDSLRYPASLTKMMTLYLVFDAIEEGRISLDDNLRVSKRAAQAPPVKLGLRPGQKLRLHDAVQALAVKSSNDVAIVLAEHIAGSEDNFARLMTEKARSLGMTSTTYRNASGLPDPYQVTTARDQARLAHSLLNIHRRHYHYFGQQTFTYKGRTLRNHNTLLGTVEGVDGFKTGYTRDSGYNLTISAQRGGRRIIAVVMGGASGKSRDRHMTQLVNRAFVTIGMTPALIMAASRDAAPRAAISSPQAFTLRGKNKRVIKVVTGAQSQALAALPISREWRIHLGNYATAAQAQDVAHAAGMPAGLPAQSANVRKTAGGYAARLSVPNGKQAQDICARITDTGGPTCFLIAPSG